MDKKPNRDRILHVKAKKTEQGWSYAIQEFTEKATRAWFTSVNWLLATGAMQYLANEAHSILFSGLATICYALMSLYALYFFASIRIEPYHSLLLEATASTKRKALLRLLFIILYIALVIGLYVGFNFLISRAITILSETSPIANS